MLCQAGGAAHQASAHPQQWVPLYLVYMGYVKYATASAACCSVCVVCVPAVHSSAVCCGWGAVFRSARVLKRVSSVLSWGVCAARRWCTANACGPGGCSIASPIA
jgi:hypothetical protein